MRSLRFVLPLLVVAASAAPAPLSAQFTQRTATPTPAATTTSAIVGWDWAFTPNANETAAPFDATNWSLQAVSPRAGAGAVGKSLTINVQHLVAVPGHTGPVVEIGPNVARSFDLAVTFERVAAPRTTDVVIKDEHPGRDHSDLYRVVATEPTAAGAPGRVTISAMHSIEPRPGWSFEPDRFRQGQYVVTASYPTAPNERQVPPATSTRGSEQFGRGQGRVTGTLRPSTSAGQAPTDWALEIAYNPRSVTTFAFVVMRPEGGLDKAPLGMMTRFLTEDGQYFAPVLMDVQEEDLHVAVDLTQWVLAAVPFAQDEQIDVVEGRADRLPGYLVSSSPVAFDGQAGFVSETPFTGTVVVSGTADGSIVEEAGLARLLLIALAALVVALLLFVGVRRLRSTG